MKLKTLFTVLLISLAFNIPCLASVQEGVFLSNQQGREQFLNCIKKAKGPVILGAFKLHKGLLPDPEILHAVKSLTDQGIDVRLYTESRLTAEEQRQYQELQEGAALTAFKASGAKLITDLKHFTNVHMKLILTKDYAVIGTTNYDGIPQLDPKREWRDFSCILTDPVLLEELRYTLSRAEQGTPIEWTAYEVGRINDHQTRLTWGPAQHKDHLLQMIRLASKEIAIYQQDLQDTSIVEALKEKVKEGVRLRILMSYHPFSEQVENKSLPNLQLLTQEEAQVRLTGKVNIIENRPLHIHAKVMVIDNKLMYLGSSNFFPAILDPDAKNLNVGIITRDRKFIDPVVCTFEQDWKDHVGHQMEMKK